jgi:hypothetical protein
LTIIFGKITIVAEAVDELTSVDRVEFFVDNKQYAIDREQPFECLWDGAGIGRHILHIVAYDIMGNHGDKETIIWLFPV